MPAADVTVAETLTPYKTGRVLKSPLLVRPANPRRHFHAVEPADRRSRVISAKSGSADAADWATGIVVLDKERQIVVNRGGVSTLAPANKD